MGRKESNQTNKEQSVVSLIADPGIVSLITVQPHSLVEIGREIFSTVILLPLIQEVISESMCTENWLTA